MFKNLVDTVIVLVHINGSQHGKHVGLGTSEGCKALTLKMKGKKIMNRLYDTIDDEEDMSDEEKRETYFAEEANEQMERDWQDSHH